LWERIIEVYVSFFKKKKSKANASSETSERQQSKLSKEIEKMDEDRHLDLQLEELTARLNTTDDNTFTPAEEPPVKPNTQGHFISESLKGFSAPAFTAKVQSDVKNIDVTPEPEAKHAPQVGLNQNSDIVANKATVATQDETLAFDDDPLALDESDALPDVSPELNLAGPQRLDMSEMRLDVAKISADIESGEELYRRALNRVEGLMGFVEKAEIDFSVLNRLEPENRRLKAKLRTANGDVETVKGKLSLVKADLEDHQNRLEEKSKQYEAARAKLITAASSLQEYERLLKTTKTEAERHALTVDRQNTALSVESTENKVLREKISELSASLANRQQEFLEASKVVESLKSDCADFREQADSYRIEAQDLRVALNTAKRQNNAMKGEMTALHEDIKTFKTQYEFNVISREDQVTDLEAQIDFLAKEVDIKAQLAQSATQDIASLRSVRNAQDIERDRLEKKLALTLEELRDTQNAAEAQNSERTRDLESKLRNLQNELSVRDDYKRNSSQQLAQAELNIGELSRERDALRIELETTNQKLESIARDNPAQELQKQISNLSGQLQIKDDIVRSAAIDVTRLTQERDTHRAENRRLEKLIHSQTFQLEAAQKALSQSKQTETELDQKYRDITAALAVNQTRRRSENTTDKPDIKPDIFDDLKELSGDDIENRILDYKFGIRKEIT
jgi:chromosome segregation ATPase